jgi:hypothetical protein
MGLDVEKVKKRIRSIYDVRRAQIYGISLQYAAMALRDFQIQQRISPHSFGNFWNNQTAQAAARVFSRAFKDERSVGWFLAHGVFYGVYLELANDRKHEALRPIVQQYAEKFLKDIRKLYVK